MNDDDLLGDFGDDFNILEFADALDGNDTNKTNILDDLEEDDKDGSKEGGDKPPPYAGGAKPPGQPQDPSRPPPPPYPGQQQLGQQQVGQQPLGQQVGQQQLSQQPQQQPQQKVGRFVGFTYMQVWIYLHNLVDWVFTCLSVDFSSLSWTRVVVPIIWHFWEKCIDHQSHGMGASIVVITIKFAHMQ